MPYYSRNVSVAAELESTLAAGQGCVLTIGAAVAGALPAAAPAVTNGGNGYPASSTLNVRLMDINGNASATGTITTSATGVVTAATVTSTGGSYTHTAPATFSVRGTDPSYGVWGGIGPTGYLADARQGVLIGSDFEYKFMVDKVERDVLRGFMGGKETVPGAQWVEMSFTTELAPSGVRGVRPTWSKLLLAAGFAEGYSLTAGAVNKIEYFPVSDNFWSLSLRVLFGGTSLRVRGARVSKVEMSLGVNGLPTCKWTIVGLLYGYTTNAFYAIDMKDWVKPQVILDGNTNDLRFGCAYNLTTGAFTGGTAYPSKGWTLSVENNAKFRPLLGGDSIPITQRNTRGDFVADLTDVQRVDWWQRFSTNATDTLGFSIGTVVGSILRLYMPQIELGEPRNIDDDGLFFTGTSFRCRPSWANGNDELRIALL